MNPDQPLQAAELERFVLGRKKARWDGVEQIEPASGWFLVENDMRLDACDYIEVVRYSDVARLLSQALEDRKTIDCEEGKHDECKGWGETIFKAMWESRGGDASEPGNGKTRTDTTRVTGGGPDQTGSASETSQHQGEAGKLAERLLGDEARDAAQDAAEGACVYTELDDEYVRLMSDAAIRAALASAKENGE